MNLRVTLCALALTSLFACKKTSVTEETGDLSSISTGKPVSGNTCGNYLVDLSIDKVSQPGNTIFTWTIQNPNPGNGSGSTIQNLSHWAFIPSTCLDDNWQDVLSASYNSGAGWVTITPTPNIGPDPSMVNNGCYLNDVFKFDQGTKGSTITYYRLVLEGNWGTGDLNAFFKSGSVTGCCQRTIAGKGIGCREDEACSFSQGYWFANNEMHPNGVHPWNQTVTVGGYVYTNDEGLAIWNASNSGGIKVAKKAFTQLSALRLSGEDSNPAIAGAVATIDNWLSNFGSKLTPANLRNQTALEISLYGDANAAAEAISDWINLNHCIN